jgi:hypothetical protein
MTFCGVSQTSRIRTDHTRFDPKPQKMRQKEIESGSIGTVNDRDELCHTLIARKLRKNRDELSLGSSWTEAPAEHQEARSTRFVRNRRCGNFCEDHIDDTLRVEEPA